MAGTPQLLPYGPQGGPDTRWPSRWRAPEGAGEGQTRGQTPPNSQGGRSEAGWGKTGPPHASGEALGRGRQRGRRVPRGPCWRVQGRGEDSGGTRRRDAAQPPVGCSSAAGAAGWTVPPRAGLEPGTNAQTLCFVLLGCLRFLLSGFSRFEHTDPIRVLLDSYRRISGLSVLA